MTINEMFVEAFRGTPIDKEYTTDEIIRILNDKYGVNQSSVIPSDICYNSSNKQIEGNGSIRVFIKVRRGVYRYVGTDFDARTVNPHEFGTIK